MHIMTLARPPSQDAMEAQIKVIIVTITAIWPHSVNITAKLVSSGSTYESRLPRNDLRNDCTKAMIGDWEVSVLDGTHSMRRSGSPQP